MKLLTPFILLSAVLVTGCGQLVSSGGMPDEMAVVSGPPLTLPPNFELRPPSEQKASKAEAIRKESSSAEAQAILMGQSDGKKAEGTDWLLDKAGADDANPDIRQTLGSDEEGE